MSYFLLAYLGIYRIRDNINAVQSILLDHKPTYTENRQAFS